MNQQFNPDAALAAALAAADAASKALMARFQPTGSQALQMWMKSPGALVTDADMAADRAIAEALRRAGAPGRLLSEESRSGDGGDALTWLVDPLCGTVPFSTGMVHWGVNIALRDRGALELGVVSLPPLGEMLSAARGQGATRNRAPWRPEPQPFSGARLGDVAVGLEIDGSEAWTRLLKKGLSWVPRCGQVNTFASAAYPMGIVCLGRLSALVIYGVEPVHLAAGAVVALELGVEVTDAVGTSIDWSSDGELPVVVAGWPDIHAQLIEALQSA